MSHTYLPEYNFRVVGFLQEAVESPTCPHFVTGSAMSILRQEILGKGALYGRFMNEPIEAFTDFYGAELAMRAGHYYEVKTPHIMGPVISERCGGNPFYITSVVRQAARQCVSIDNEETLNKLLAIDISSGFIWAELHEQVMRWITKINEYGITKRILYLAVLETEDHIDLHRIQKDIKRYEDRDVDISVIKDILVKLSRGDLIEYKSFGDWFGKVNDPILEEFLKVWGRIEAFGEPAREVKDEVLRSFQKMKKRFSEYKGYLAEVFMVQILLSSQRKTLPGKFFHLSEDVKVPDFTYIDQRRSLGAGKGLEIDIYGAAGIEVWIGQSKWLNDRKAGVSVVEHLLKQAAHVKEHMEDDLEILRLWLFAHDGVTDEAEKLLLKHEILWSTRAELDDLLEFLNLRKLPVLDR
jgi:hypothetical protein